MIGAYLRANGWARNGADYVDAAGDRRIDVSGDYGYAWELERFDIAAARWVTAAEGDTLAELVAELAGACENCNRRDARAGSGFCSDACEKAFQEM